MKNPFRREPDAEVTITVSKSETASVAMLKHAQFVSLCMAHDVSIVGYPKGPEMTLRGRPKKVAAFKRAYDLRVAMGAL